VPAPGRDRRLMLKIAPLSVKDPRLPKSYLAGVVSDQSARLAIVLAGLWLTPFVLRFLDREAYGVFALAMSVITWLQTLDLGTSAGLQAHLARDAGTATDYQASRYVSSTFFAQLFLAAVTLCLGVAAAAVVPNFFEVREDLRPDTATLCAALAAGMAVSQIAKSYKAALMAYQKIHVNHLLQLVSVAVRVIITVWLFVAGWGLIALGVAHVVASVAAAALTVLLCRRLLPAIVVRPSSASLRTLRTIGGSAIWFSLGGIAGILILGTDRAVAAKVLSLEAVAVLFLSGRLFGLAESLLGPIADTARPVLGTLLGQGRSLEAHQTFELVNRALRTLAVVSALATWAGNREFVTAWVGAENYGGWALDAAFAAALFARLGFLPCRALLASALVVKPQTLARLVEGAVNLFLTVVLAKLYGLVGVVLSTPIATTLTSAWYLPRLVGQVFGGQAPPRPGSSSMLLLAVSLVCAAGSGRLVAAFIGGFAGAGIAMVMTFASGLAAFWMFATDAAVRVRIRALLPA